MYKSEQEEMRALLKRKPKRKTLRLFDRDDAGAGGGRDGVVAENDSGSNLFFMNRGTDTFRHG